MVAGSEDNRQLSATSMLDDADRVEQSRLTQSLQVVIVALLVALIVTVVYAPVLDAQALCFDDEEAISANTLVQNPSWRSVGRFFGEITRSSVVKGYYRPLTLTSLMLDWAMGGRPDDLRAFHRTSLALHVGSTVLVILLCYQIFGRPVVAAMVGLLFGLHPLTVEPVAWIMERKTILAAIFAFACLNAYVRYIQVGGKRWYITAMVLYLISLLAKPTVTPLPLMMILMDYWPLKRLTRRAILEKIPFAILAALFTLLCLVCEQKVNPLSIPAKLAVWHLPLRLCWLAVFYPFKILLPMNLTPAYCMPDALTFGNATVVLSVAIVAIALVVLVIFRRRMPALWVSAAIFYVGLSPTMGFVGYSWVAASDKYVYLPAVGLLLLVAWLLSKLVGDKAKGSSIGRTSAVVLGVAVIAVLLGIGTRRYIAQWRTSDRHKLYMLKLAPDLPITNYCYARQCFKNGDLNQAIDYYSRAIELKPNDKVYYYRRAIAYYDLHRLDMAIRDYSKAIEIDPEFDDGYCDRGSAYIDMRDYDKAIHDFNRAIELNPELAEAYYNRGTVYSSVQEFQRAITDYNKAIELNPGFSLAYFNRGNTYMALRNIEKAIQDYSIIIANVADPTAYNMRAIAYIALGDYEQAITDSDRAIELSPNMAIAYNNRAVGYYWLKEYDKAWSDVERSQKLGGQVNPHFLEILEQASPRLRQQE